MNTTIMAIALESRNRFAPNLQEVLTKHGCIISMRLGLHETSKDLCAERGLILLQLCAEEEEISALKEELGKIEGIKINTMSI
ncbi:MAG TPA: hypothetical protein VIM70_00255 [Clostridium sp.]|uniref:hypothetical protein n=1 Tax=Clostridium sp. TaxID=1506 RepID=UPI002F94657C